MPPSVRTVASALAAVLLSCLAAAQSPLFAEVGEALPDGMGQVFASADYEGDGDPDLFTPSGVFLNTLGFFTPGPVIPPPPPPAFLPLTQVLSVAVADFTGDGFVDVLGGPHGGLIPGMVLFKSPGPVGTAFIATPVAVAGVTVMHSFTAADFEGDGDVDVIAASSSGGAPQWELLLNDGSGVFSVAPASQWPPAPIAATGVVKGDFDGDGYLDVFATSQTNAVWRRRLPTGNFSATMNLPSTLLADRDVVGDFNGDSIDDVFVVDVAGNEAVHLGSAAGLVAGVSSPFGILGPPPFAFDLDGDGDDEILRTVVNVSGHASGILYLRVGSPGGPGPATLLGPMSFGYGNPRPFPGFAALDVEGDNDIDLAVVPGAEGSWLAINGGPAGYTVAPKSIPFGFTGLFLPPRDIDGDGDGDLVGGSLASGVITLQAYKNDGRGFPGAAAAAGSYPNLFVQAKSEWCDLDLDGDSDFWVGSFGPPAATGPDSAVLNDGTGVFSLGPTVTNAGPTGAIAFGDFDGDVDVDVVIGRATTGTFPPTYHAPLLIRATPGPGGLAYAAPSPFGVPESISDIAVFDPEPDGDLDLLVGTVGLGGAPAAPRIYVNNGAGGFLGVSMFPGATASTVAAGDLNGDTFIDVVLAGQTWLRTPAAFALHGTHAAPLARISLADLDIDGDLDLVDAAGRWYPGDGLGAFGAPIAFVPAPSGFGQLRAAPMDLDSDGDLDLVGPAGHFTIFWNMARQAGRTSLVSQGLQASLAVFGAPNAPFVLAGSGAGAAPQPMPPFGTLFLDLPTAAIVASGNLSPGGRADVFGTVPSGPGLAGFTVTWQALVAGAFTNSFDTIVLP
jgi:hypothetical protein